MIGAAWGSLLVDVASLCRVVIAGSRGTWSLSQVLRGCFGSRGRCGVIAGNDCLVSVGAV